MITMGNVTILHLYNYGIILKFIKLFLITFTLWLFKLFGGKVRFLQHMMMVHCSSVWYRNPTNEWTRSRKVKERLKTGLSRTSKNVTVHSQLARMDMHSDGDWLFAVSVLSSKIGLQGNYPVITISRKDIEIIT